MPESAKFDELEKICEVLEVPRDDDESAKSGEHSFTINNRRDFSSMFYDEEDLSPGDEFRDINFHAGYKREHEHR